MMARCGRCKRISQCSREGEPCAHCTRRLLRSLNKRRHPVSLDGLDAFVLVMVTGVLTFWLSH